MPARVPMTEARRVSLLALPVSPVCRFRRLGRGRRQATRRGRAENRCRRTDRGRGRRGDPFRARRRSRRVFRPRHADRRGHAGQGLSAKGRYQPVRKFRSRPAREKHNREGGMMASRRKRSVWFAQNHRRDPRPGHGRLLRSLRGCAAGHGLRLIAVPKVLWAGIHRQGRAGLDCGGRRENGVHRTGEPLGERLLRELQFEASGRAAERRDLLLAGRGARGDRGVAGPLQFTAPAFGDSYRSLADKERMAA